MEDITEKIDSLQAILSFCMDTDTDNGALDGLITGLCQSLEEMKLCA